MGRVGRKPGSCGLLALRGDARCTNATGPSCDCSCGGVNHGTHRVVAITLWWWHPARGDRGRRRAPAQSRGVQGPMEPHRANGRGMPEARALLLGRESRRPSV